MKINNNEELKVNASILKKSKNSAIIKNSIIKIFNLND